MTTNPTATNPTTSDGQDRPKPRPARSRKAERRGFARMGSRPSSDIIYGFTYAFDYESEKDPTDTFYELNQAWKAKAFAAAGFTDTPSFSEEDAALRESGQLVLWGDKYDGDTSYAFGFVLASGDWDRAEEIIDLTIPDDADEKLRALAEFFGVPVQPAKLLLLSSYG